MQLVFKKYIQRKDISGCKKSLDFVFTNEGVYALRNILKLSLNRIKMNQENK